MATQSEFPIQPHTVDFDTASFDVLADNCANRTISPHKDDFENLSRFNSQVTGVGQAQICGRGTIRWLTQTDDGQLVEIVDHNAICIPDMSYRILSVAEWGKQRTLECDDGLNDLTTIKTDADNELSTLKFNRNANQVTIHHTNGLPKMCCSSPRTQSLETYAADFSCYNSVCQPINTQNKCESLCSVAGSMYYNDIMENALRLSPTEPELIKNMSELEFVWLLFGMCS